jgi:methanethiol oxidase
MPGLGDELHHFGWNACSAALCPYAPYPHIERRYLLVPGLRSSRVHVIDTKTDPTHPEIVRVIEPKEIAARSGYNRPHTIHCGPDAIYVSALGAPDGGGPGGIFLLDHESFDVLGRFEVDRGPQYLAYDFWWHLGYDVAVTSEWGTPNMIENGLNFELLTAGKYGHAIHIWDLRRRRVIQSLDLGAEHQMALELRPAYDPTKAYGFLGVVVSTKDLSASIWTWRRDNGKWSVRKVIEIPAEPADPARLPHRAKAVQGRAASHHRHQSEPRRPLSLRRVLGDGRSAMLRRERAAEPTAQGFSATWRDRESRRASERRRTERWTADARGQPRRQAHLFQ